MFELDPRLAADTVELARWSLCRVLLMNDTNYPWLILVPQRPGLRDFDEVAGADRGVLDGEITDACAALRKMTKPHKLNVASLGNAVAQLHIHIIARQTADPAWPRPVWGVVPVKQYGPEALASFRERFAAAATR
ncbi:MAG TPA: HIT domain-containing protein [Alphaproteobacteria bacterium]|nr:HIT domain-containing protein [Alphaproteobacteria bacterium]